MQIDIIPILSCLLNVPISHVLLHISTIFIGVNLSLMSHSIELDIWEIEDKIWGEILVEALAIDHIKTGVLFELTHQLVDILLKSCPQVYLLLNFVTLLWQLLVQPLKTTFSAKNVILFRYGPQSFLDFLAKIVCLFDKHLLHIEQIPFLFDTLEQLVEKDVKFFFQRISDE